MSSEIAEQPNWQTIAMVYRKRLEAICFFAAFASYAAMGFATVFILEWLRLDSVWVETISSVVWLPLGVVAYYLKNILEDLAGKVKSST